MTISKRAGVYFTEATGSVATEQGGYVPLFIVQTATAIPSIDDQLILYNSVEAFARTVEEKGLTKTVQFIRQALSESGIGKFYVFSIKTDSAEGFANAIKGCASRSEIRDIVYIEETKSTTQTSVSAKATAIKTALDDNYLHGTPRTSLIVPLGTVADAVTTAENTAPKTTVISQLTSIFNGINSGRVTGLVPDEVIIGAGIGKFIGRADNEEIGATTLNTSVDALTYDFDDNEILTLCNIGCLVVTPYYNRGNIEYKVELGVTTSIKDSSADQLLITRSIADALLREVKYECDSYIKQKLTQNTIGMLQTDIDAIVADYVAREDVVNEGTKLTVSQASQPYTVNVTGGIQAVGSLLVINVDTTLTV